MVAEEAARSEAMEEAAMETARPEAMAVDETVVCQEAEVELKDKVDQEKAGVVLDRMEAVALVGAAKGKGVQ